MATKPAAKPTAKSKPAATTTTTAAKAVKPVTTNPAKPAVAKPAAAKAPVSKAPASNAVVKPTAKPTAKPAAKPAAKPVTKASAPVAKKPAAAPAAKTPAKAVVANDKPKTPKVKMERDSFTMPKDEYAQIAALKKRLEGLGKPVKKSELLRAGLKLLSTLNDAALKAALDTVPTIKTGRPKK